MNFELGDVLARASQITWKHKILWVFNTFPVLLSFIFVPIVFIPMFFIGPNALINQDRVNQSYYVSLFIIINLILGALSILLSAAGAASSSLGILRVENGREQLSLRDLFQDGLEYYWPILGIMLLIGGVASLVILLLSGSVVMVGMATQGVGMICLLPLLFFLPLTMEGPEAGFDPQRFGWLLILVSAILLPILALIQGVALTYIKSAFMIVYFRLTRSTVVQTALQ